MYLSSLFGRPKGDLVHAHIKSHNSVLVLSTQAFRLKVVKSRLHLFSRLCIISLQTLAASRVVTLDWVVMIELKVQILII